MVKRIKETRTFSFNNEDDKLLNARAETTETGQRFIEGYAALFNRASKLLAEYHKGEFVEFKEIIKPGAFDYALRSEHLNVLHTIDHDRYKMVARTKSGTLQLSADDIGLKYRFEVPNTSLGNDLYEMIKRGDYFESSFIFTIDTEGEEWERKPDGILYRYITSIYHLYDTSTVIDGAYSDTVVVARNLDEFIEAQPIMEEQQVEETNTSLTDQEKLKNEIFIIENGDFPIQ